MQDTASMMTSTTRLFLGEMRLIVNFGVSDVNGTNFRRRGTKIRLTVDDNDPVLAEIVTGSQSLYMGYRKIYFGGIEQEEIIPSQAPGLVGYMSQVRPPRMKRIPPAFVAKFARFFFQTV